MGSRRCPVRTRYWTPEDLFEILVHCGAPWSSSKMTCAGGAHCGRHTVNPRNDMACAAWCRWAAGAWPNSDAIPQGSGGEGVGLKLAVSGKGGVGKSTLAGTLARLFAEGAAARAGNRCRPRRQPGFGARHARELQAGLQTIAEQRQLIEEYWRPGRATRPAFHSQPGRGRHRRAVCRPPRWRRPAGAGRRAARGRWLCLPGKRAAQSPVRDLVVLARRGRPPRYGSRYRAPGARHRHGVDLMLVVVEPGRRSVKQRTGCARWLPASASAGWPSW